MNEPKVLDLSKRETVALKAADGMVLPVFYGKGIIFIRDDKPTIFEVAKLRYEPRHQLLDAYVRGRIELVEQDVSEAASSDLDEK